MNANSVKATIAIIVALEKELAAVKLMMNNPREYIAPRAGSGKRYIVGQIPSASRRPHVVAAGLLTEMGNNNAAVCAHQFLVDIPSVERFVMCGIAGAIMPADLKPGVPRLGDIVVSDRKGVIQYDFVKDSGSELATLEHRNPPRPPDAEFLEAVRLLKAYELEGSRPWERYLGLGRKLKDGERPPNNVDSRGDLIEYPPDADRRQGFPEVFIAPIASANRLLKNSCYRDFLGDKFGARAVEMEGSGIADAGWLSGRPGYLVIRGIADYCDSRKGDLWQGYAAVAAASYLRAFLEILPSDIDGKDSALRKSAPARGRLLWVDDLGPAGFTYEVEELSEAGWETEFSTSVEDAALKLASGNYDLVLLDQLIPYDRNISAEVGGWGGVVLFSWLRGKGHPQGAPETALCQRLELVPPQPGNQHIPVVLVTAFHSSSTRVAFEVAKDHGEQVPLVSKPVLADELMLLIERLAGESDG
jgi:nucleoside phosphorylase/CheY-like chemotaxis protein